MSSTFTVAWIPPIIAYCTASILMTLVNKLVLSNFQYKLNFMMLAVQAISSVMLLRLFTILGWTKHRPLNKPDIQRWFPVAILMGVMLFTGSKSLQYLSVPIFTIFKNLSIILVAYGETKVFGGRVTSMMLGSFLMMALSSVIAASADLSANADNKAAKNNAMLGYFWMTLNCLSSASFVLVMRWVIKRTASQGSFRDFDTVYYNNVLTAPMFLIMTLLGLDGNLSEFWTYYSEHDDEFRHLVLALLFSGVSAFWISYASSWCMRVTNSTTYSMVGALNKLPIAVSGLLVFKDTPITLGSVGSILLGFASGVVYTIAKLRYDQEQKLKASSDPLLPLSRQSSEARFLNPGGLDSIRSSQEEDELLLYKKYDGANRAAMRWSSDSRDGDIAIHMFPTSDSAVKDRTS